MQEMSQTTVTIQHSPVAGLRAVETAAGEEVKERVAPSTQAIE